MTKLRIKLFFKFHRQTIKFNKTLCFGILALTAGSIFEISVQAAMIDVDKSPQLELGFESEFKSGLTPDFYGDQLEKWVYKSHTKPIKNVDVNTIAHQGFVLLQLGKNEEGIKFLQLAWDKAPEYRQLGIMIGFTHLKAREFKQALIVAKKLQSQYSNTPEGYVLAGFAYTGLKQHDQAKAAYQEALKINPRAPDASNQLAAYARAEKEFEQAKVLLEEVLIDYPNQKQTLKQLAEVEYKLGNHQKTVEILQKAGAAYPEDISLQVKLAQLYLALGNQQKALQISEKALKKFPDNALLLLMKGVAQLNDNRAESAIKTFEATIKISPQTFEAHYYLAKCYEQLKQYEMALKSIDNALILDSEHAGSLFLKARLLAKSGQLDEAEIQLNELAKTNKSNMDVKELQGKLALAKNQPEKAINFYQQVVKVRETNALIVQLAKAQFQAGKQKDALVTMTTWLQKFPDDVLTRVMLAEMLYMLDRFDDALVEAEKAAVKHPDNQRVLQVKKAIQAKLNTQ